MLMHEATPEMVQAWKAVWNEYRHKLRPNKKGAADIIGYLFQKYALTELTDEKWKRVVTGNVTENAYFAKKLPAGKEPSARVFRVEHSGAGSLLYENQDEIFKGLDIIVGIELETAYFQVEGSSLLWDELFAFRGLDEDDLNNYYLVAEYVSCLEKNNIK